MAANVHIASVWLLTFGSSTTATLAIRASDPLGYDRSVQSGARFVSSMWFHRLPAEKVFSDEEVDARLFHRPVDCEWTPHHSRLRPSKMGRTLYSAIQCIR